MPQSADPDHDQRLKVLLPRLLPGRRAESRPIELAVSSIAATELNRGAVSNSLDILIQAYDCLAVHLTRRTD